MRPIAILGFLLTVFAGLALIGALLPKDGIQFGPGLALRLPTAQEVLFPVRSEKVDISTILQVNTDTTASDTSALAEAEDVVDELPTDSAAAWLERFGLRFPEEDTTVLNSFFAAMKQTPKKGRPFHVLHYGDSQIEGDRITAYLRNKLQVRFGGHGMGLIAAADIVPSFSIDRVLSGNWQRYSAMGRKDPTQDHARFGALSAFSRFTPILPDSVAPDTTKVSSATLTLTRVKRSYGRARAFSTCRMFFGWHRTPLTVELLVGDEVISTEVIPPSDRLLVREWSVGTAPPSITVRFTGADSPDLFAFALEGEGGVVVDNIAARGAAGYEFRRADQALLQAMYKELDVKLLILEYGGNVVPYMKDEAEAQQYGRAFGAQIARFRKLIPGVAVIVIGPSDMSVKEGTDHVTRPFLEEVNAALKEHALAQHAAYWDLYTAMGGRNSMPSWVEADPPLAATDYTHFSPQGANKVAELFYLALEHELEQYLNAQP